MAVSVYQMRFRRIQLLTFIGYLPARLYRVHDLDDRLHPDLPLNCDIQACRNLRSSNRLVSSLSCRNILACMFRRSNSILVACR